MERKLSFTRSQFEIGSCNSCNKNNYDRDENLNRSPIVLYELRIGCMMMTLCEDCLWELIATIEEELKN